MQEHAAQHHRKIRAAAEFFTAELTSRDRTAFNIPAAVIAGSTGVNMPVIVSISRAPILFSLLLLFCIAVLAQTAFFCNRLVDMINVIADNDLILASADKCKNFIAEFLVILFFTFYRKCEFLFWQTRVTCSGSVDTEML